MKYCCTESLWNITLAYSIKNVIYVYEEYDALLCASLCEEQVEVQIYEAENRFGNRFGVKEKFHVKRNF